MPFGKLFRKYIIECGMFYEMFYGIFHGMFCNVL
jgi:hypothetical protein